ncbi:ergothioneine biosynthesis protein EgtB [Variovorax sp. HJSM1_2]|uniref:ergothioneine biosynthesis protein EgtB n=1 Tax=Variovorax sp. HJSM1_2 TaxID=3366263 RepID=UPI003BD49698
MNHNTLSLVGTHASALAPALSPLAQHFLQVRAHSLALAKPLSAEDQCVQSMPDASPTKWHLAHTTWFFETLVLCPHVAQYTVFDTQFFYLFNSYYEALGPRHPRPMRGLLTRPSLDEVLAYRAHVDAALLRWLAGATPDEVAAVEPMVTLGLHHEQQHQELLLTDILHTFSCNPLLPAYAPQSARDVAWLRLAAQPQPHTWLARDERIVEVGHAVEPGAGFAFDNETPRHRRLLPAYEIGTRLVSCGDYAAFIADGGYRRPELWLSDGWAEVQRQGWTCPAYWLAEGDTRAPGAGWRVFGLQGVLPLDPHEAVSQLSFFEAAAYAEWAGARLPTEFEWESALDAPGMLQMLGTVWQWTRSSYDPYPGFRPMAGAASEYNGKFMVGQLVLRGSSVATPPGHARGTYRNFFPPAARWQFSGLRLARDL